MSLNRANLALLVTAAGFQLWRYDAGTDTLATVMASGYFDNASGDLRVADEIRVKTADGFAVLRVDTNSGGVVTTEMGAGESVWLTVLLPDVSSAKSVWLVAPFDGFIRRFKTVLHGAITTGDAAVGIELGGTDVTGAQLTIAQSGSAAGDVDEGVATAANAVSEGDAVEIESDGGSTVDRDLTCMVEFVPA